MSSYETSAAEVAEDFKAALEEMVSVLRVEIMNLCQIARENTEYAQEISEVLQTHIRKAAPQKKLPALYVLDAIVKNIGSPYTLYLAPKLYSTFMEAYACVDHPVRRKMEDMLKTWKAPVPGSLDTRPVFPHDVVSPIENALMKAQSSALQAQQKAMLVRARASMARNTPTPPGGLRPGSARGHPYPQHQHQQPNPPSILAALPHPPPPGTDPAIQVEYLKHMIVIVIDALRAEMAQKPHDTTSQPKIHALQNLREILDPTTLTVGQLSDVRKQIESLAHSLQQQYQQQQQPPPPPRTTGTPPVPVHTPIPPPSAPVAAPAAPQAAPASAPNPGTNQASVSLDSILGPGALSALMAARNGGPKPPTPTPVAPPPTARVNTPPVTSSSAPAIPPNLVGFLQAFPTVAASLASSTTPPPPPPNLSYPVPTTSTASAPTSAVDLISQLRGAGLLLPTTSTSTNSTLSQTPLTLPTSSTPQITSTSGPAHTNASLPPILASFLAAQKKASSISTVTPVASTPLDQMNAIELNLASLRIDRSRTLLPTLLDQLGKPCLQCGRRFPATEEGKRNRIRHMDWHFKVHQRSAEAERRGQHRSWYVGKDEWTTWREEDDSENAAQADRPDGNKTGSLDGSTVGQAGNSNSSSGHSASSPGSRVTSRMTMNRTVPTNQQHQQQQHFDVTTTTSQNANTTLEGTYQVHEGVRYIPVPDPTEGVNASCPICIDTFVNKWLDDLQEWVWLDVLRVADKAYHIACYVDTVKVREQQQQQQQQQQYQREPSKTTMSLGKRKTPPLEYTLMRGKPKPGRA